MSITVGATQLDKWRQCPRQWVYKALRVPAREQDTEALDFGVAVHRALERAGKQEIPRTVRAMCATASEVLSERGRAPDPLVGRLAGAFRNVRRMGGFTGAEHFERAIRANAPSVPQAAFFGMIDRIDRRAGEMVLVDYKTGKPKDERWADASVQATAYLWALLDPSVRIEFWYVEHDVIVSTRRTQAQLNDFGAWLDTTVRAMIAAKAAREPERAEARPSPLCGWCGWADRCPAVARPREIPFDKQRKDNA